MPYKSNSDIMRIKLLHDDILVMSDCLLISHVLKNLIMP